MSGRGHQIYRVVYWTLVIGLGISVSMSITVHAVQGVMSRRAGEVALAPDDDCRADQDRMVNGLHQQAASLLQAPKRTLPAAWRDWSINWRASFEAMRRRCTPPKGHPEHEERRRALADVERLHLAYTTAFKGFAEVGGKALERLSAP